jgi:hypothetical protein
MKPPRLLALLLLAAVAGPSVHAFHHEPPPKAKPSEKPAAVSFAPEAKADAAIEKFFRALALGLHQRDGQPVVALLAPDYTIEGLPANAAQSPAEIFGQAIERINAPEEFVITAVRPAADGPTVKAELQFPNRVVTRTFKFDPTGRLQRSDFFKINAQPHGAPPPPPAAPAGMPVISFAPGVEANPHFAEFLGNFAAALLTDEQGKINPPRADFTVAQLADVRGPAALRGAGARLGGRLDEITFTGRREAKEGSVLLLRFRGGDRSWPAELHFDSNMALASAVLLPPAN